jgi:Mrp family chromosome partitioning ATPase
MPSGILPPNVPELLESHAMDSLLRVLEKCNVDIIIFDTPPLLGLSDVSILMRRTDAVLFVVDIANTRKKSIQRAKAQLSQAGVRVLGCVVNKQAHDHKDSSYYYNYYYSSEKPQENGHVRQLVTAPMSTLLTPFSGKPRTPR